MRAIVSSVAFSALNSKCVASVIYLHSVGDLSDER